MSSEDEMKKFIPEAILEEGDQIVDFKLEPSSPGDLVPEEFMGGLPHSPMELGDDEMTLTNIDSVLEEPVLIVMDIREPLTTLQSLLEDKLGFPFDYCSFSLQESQILDHDKNLVDLCVQGEGIVQINCELKRTNNGIKVNIADVLKPAEEYVEIGGEDDEDGAYGVDVRWAVDTNFKRDQEKLGIPEDPYKWSVENVRHWLMWAVRQFSLSGIKLSEWQLTGSEVLKMSKEEFRARVPVDNSNAFWVHLELLKTCKIVAINKKSDDLNNGPTENPSDVPTFETKKEFELKQKPHDRIFKMNKLKSLSPYAFPDSEDDYQGYSVLGDNEEDTTYSNTGSGPVQLWQFLLELLTNRDHRNAIQWLEDEGEFKLINPELVAHLWGIRKNKPTMNYEKLSRALRYYYDGEMISKVNGKRFTYKFVCDLKQLIGYSASELNARVIEGELKAKFASRNEEERFPIFVNEFITLIP